MLGSTSSFLPGVSFKRVLVFFNYKAHGIELVETKEDKRYKTMSFSHDPSPLAKIYQIYLDEENNNLPAENVTITKNTPGSSTSTKTAVPVDRLMAIFFPKLPLPPGSNTPTFPFLVPTRLDEDTRNVHKTLANYSGTFNWLVFTDSKESTDCLDRILQIRARKKFGMAEIKSPLLLNMAPKKIAPKLS